MKFKKLLISSAIAAVIGVAASNASADSVASMSIEEIGTASSGLGTSAAGTGGGVFYFSTEAQIPDGSNSSSPTTFNFTSPPGIINGTNQTAVSTSFLYGGTTALYTFQPNSCGASKPCTPTSPTGLAATYNAGTLTINLNDFGGFYKLFNAQFPLFPDSVQQALKVSASALGAGSLGADQFYYTLDWSHTITSAENSLFGGSVADWHLEGVGTLAPAAVPVPAAVWLFGSGLLGLVGVARRKKAKTII